MGNVVPGPNFFLTGTGTKMFFLDRDRDQNIFDWDRDQNLFLKGPGPRPKTFSRRDRNRNFFLTGTGTKNDWSRSCLVLFQKLSMIKCREVPNSCIFISINDHMEYVLLLSILFRKNNSRLNNINNDDLHDREYVTRCTHLPSSRFKVFSFIQ